MIRNNLASLLAERSIKITKVATDTDLSRNTITSTAQNDGKMIQLETINSLCKYLEITPSDFFSFLPFDIDFTVFPSNNFKYERLENDIRKLVDYSFDCYLKVIYKDRTKTYDIPVFLDGSTLYFGKYNVLSDSYDTNIHFLLGKENTDFHKFWVAIPAGFKSDITKMMENKIISNFKEYIYSFNNSNTFNADYLFENISFNPIFEFVDISEFHIEFDNNMPSKELIKENERHLFDNLEDDDLPF